MDYIRRTVTFELRSIIRNCAIKPLEALAREGLHVYMHRRHDAARVLRPRISIKTSNFIFKFTGTIVAPIVHVPCHLQARLPSSGRVPSRFSTILLFLFSSLSQQVSPARSVRCVSSSVFSPRFPRGKPIAIEMIVSTYYHVLFSRRSLYRRSPPPLSPIRRLTVAC